MGGMRWATLIRVKSDKKKLDDPFLLILFIDLLGVIEYYCYEGSSIGVNKSFSLRSRER